MIPRVLRSAPHPNQRATGAADHAPGVARLIFDLAPPRFSVLERLLHLVLWVPGPWHPRNSIPARWVNTTGSPAGGGSLSRSGSCCSPPPGHGQAGGGRRRLAWGDLSRDGHPGRPAGPGRGRPPAPGLGGPGGWVHRWLTGRRRRYPQRPGGRGGLAQRTPPVELAGARRRAGDLVVAHGPPGPRHRRHRLAVRRHPADRRPAGRPGPGDRPATLGRLRPASLPGRRRHLVGPGGRQPGPGLRGRRQPG